MGYFLMGGTMVGYDIVSQSLKAKLDHQTLKEVISPKYGLLEYTDTGYTVSLDILL